jgi:hypothetical protein
VDEREAEAVEEEVAEDDDTVPARAALRAGTRDGEAVETDDEDEDETDADACECAAVE